MSDTGRQSPLGANQINSYLQNKGLHINPTLAGYTGTSVSMTDYTPGSICKDTVLNLITYAIHRGFTRPLDESTYNNIISIGSGQNSLAVSISSTHEFFELSYFGAPSVSENSYIRINDAIPSGYNGNWLVTSVKTTQHNNQTIRIKTTVDYGTGSGTMIYSTSIPSLGNAKPVEYDWDKPNGKYGTGADFDTVGWGGTEYKAFNPATQWGYVRLHALQAEMEWNYNSTQTTGTDDNPAGYRDFLGSFLQAQGWIDNSNKAILAIGNSKKFLDGAFSNMDDLITADVTNVCKATRVFGQDLINLGKAIDLETISTFGLPSNLLATLVRYKGITKDVSLAILSSGIAFDQLEQLLGGSKATTEQERKLYGAFSLITGPSLNEIFTSLNFNIGANKVVNSLADMLNVAKMFPNSYAALTVPVYNTQLGLPTKSKTFYKIYASATGANNDYSVNAQLTSTQVDSQLGTGPSTGSPSTNSRLSINNPLTPQPHSLGFGAYLSTILPSDLATAAGAFAVSMGQIKNISHVPIEKFAQIVRNLETTYNAATGQSLDVNGDEGTSMPASMKLRNESLPLIALGSGPQKTYTMSDLFGAVSGLPYNGPFKNTLEKIKQLTTPQLTSIYRNLYLAVDWDQAGGVASASTSYTMTSPYVPANPLDPLSVATPALYKLSYTITGAGLTNPGGGYSREGALSPIVTFSDGSGAIGSCSVDTNDQNIATTFGKVTGISVSGGSAVEYAWGVPAGDGMSGAPNITPPPPIYVTIEAPPIGMTGVNSPSGTIGWPSMNSIVQNYINQANNEINSIMVNKPSVAASLNQSWAALGTQLSIEQRARASCYRPPLTSPRDNFLNMSPTIQYSFVDGVKQMSLNTEPHMYAQTIEAISDMSTVGGQSAVAHGRESRNQDRLSAAGIPQDNSIPSTLQPAEQKFLIANGVLSPTDSVPATLVNVAEPDPLGYFNPATNNYIPYFKPDSPNQLPGGQSGMPVYNGTAVNPLESPITPSGVNPSSGGSPLDAVTRAALPTSSPVGPGVYTGIAPGTFADSPYANVISPNLNSLFTSRTLLPSTYPISAAIDEVVRCNCDCWALI